MVCQRGPVVAAITPIYIILAIAVGVLTSRTIEQPFLILRDRLFPRRPVRAQTLVERCDTVRPTSTCMRAES